MKIWRLLDTGKLPGSLNMAIDEALLQLHAHGKSPPTLRFYQWNPPAVSLGYFQRKHSINTPACRRIGLDVVRRLTGGRAVLHQEDLTYSVVAGAREGMPVSLSSAYRMLCEGLIAGFRLFGFDAEPGREKTRSAQADICFMRSAVGDIVWRGKKFVGSAQTWIGTSLLQHGSIVLEPQEDTWAAILEPGAISGISGQCLREKLRSRTASLEEIVGCRVEPRELKTAIAAGMAQVLGIELQTGDLSHEEWSLANELASKRGLSEDTDDQGEKSRANVG
jgi:lipoate-protein ligase A